MLKDSHAATGTSLTPASSHITLLKERLGKDEGKEGEIQFDPVLE